MSYVSYVLFAEWRGAVCQAWVQSLGHCIVWLLKEDLETVQCADGDEGDARSDNGGSEDDEDEDEEDVDYEYDSDETGELETDRCVVATEGVLGFGSKFVHSAGNVEHAC